MKYKCHCTEHLKMVTMVNFMFCVFGHNENKQTAKKKPLGGTLRSLTTLSRTQVSSKIEAGG